MNQKLAKKRMKASLDRQSKKYIIKNIKTCTNFAKTQRDKVQKSILSKSGATRTIITDNSQNPQKIYDNFLDDG